MKEWTDERIAEVRRCCDEHARDGIAPPEYRFVLAMALDEIDRLNDCLTTQNNRANRRLREIERLREAIEKLPKCWRLDEDGKLVCDVPVVPGMDVVLGNYPPRLVEAGVLRIEENDNSGDFDQLVLRDGDGVEWEKVLASWCYSTKAAAEAAREQS